MKKLIVLSTILLMNFVYVDAHSLTGLVTNSNNEPLASVSILNISTREHTHSNEDGIFKFDYIHIGNTLQFSHIGYQALEFTVENLTDTLKVILEEKLFTIDEVVVGSGLSAMHAITDIDLKVNPVNSSQEVLQTVPGLIIGQHAGGGKAEQVFLRGFDIDHGTDINITVDGIPVNMVSHAHGQGYADLHFVIPEIIDKVDFGKGAYNADVGNFSTAGHINFKTKQKLEKQSLKIEGGQFNTMRMVSMLNLLNNSDHSSYIAAEYQATDGPFESPQNFSRINLFAKYEGNITKRDKISFSVSYFTSKWDASGQIPARAVDDGTITRFGAIDDTEGGTTSRVNTVLSHQKALDKNSFILSKVFYSHYEFDLFSNFTFFLEDPVNGDQIRQKESRDLFGFNSEYNRPFKWGNGMGIWQAGIGLRNDRSIGNELSHTLNRTQTLDQWQLGDINETNAGAYLNMVLNFGKWTINPAFRVDFFDFQYNDALAIAYKTQAQNELICSPKLNVMWNLNDDLQLYLKSGKGFHSNDTRVVVAQNGNSILPASYGADVGFIWKPLPSLFINTAYWYLFLEQEFVYVGDAGIVEPSGKTQRQGGDLSVRYQPFSWLFLNYDANYAYARSVDEPEGENYVPLAPDLTMAGGFYLKFPMGFYGGLNARFVDDRPANEDNSIVAEGYTIIDVNIGYRWNKIDFGIQIQNLLNEEWNETQFATESRLQNETQPVEEIHFIPGTPFFFKAGLEFNF